MISKSGPFGADLGLPEHRQVFFFFFFQGVCEVIRIWVYGLGFRLSGLGFRI